MKTSRKFLVAIATTGIISPLAASAQEIASLSGRAAVSSYTQQQAEDRFMAWDAKTQVTSVNQFTDVQPTDWAYQALSNLVEKYGCVAGYPDGKFKGAQAMTRYEAAALLNACLDRVTETTDELKKLMAEFQKELTVLKGRVDGLDARVGVLEATQFSTTTKLKGTSTMVLGGASNGANASGLGTGNAQSNVTFNYDVRLSLDTSFTGKDLLRTRLRSGNFANSVFGNGNTTLETAFQEADLGNGVDVVGIDRLFYQFPISKSVTATFGAKVRQDDMLALWPSSYPADTILDLFTYAGAGGTYSLNLGGGAGIWYKKDGFSLSANFVSTEAATENSTLGVGEGYTFTAQAGYAGTNWGVALAYTYADLSATGAFGVNPYLSNGGLSAYWQPSVASWVPSISAGVGFGNSNQAAIDNNYSWMVGLQWADAFMKGNALGMALGTSGQLRTGAPTGRGIVTNNGESNLAYELWYKFQVTDNISVTPGFFWIENSATAIAGPGSGDDTYGALVKTTFKF
jgi:hypothetical protein